MSVPVTVPVYVPEGVLGTVKEKLAVAELPAGTETELILGAEMVFVPSLNVLLVLDTVIAVAPAFVYTTSNVTLDPGSPDFAAMLPLSSSAAAAKAKAIRNTSIALVMNFFMI